MNINSLAVDLDKVKEGVWIGDIPDFEGIRLKVRPANCQEYRTLYSQLVERTPRNLKRGGIIEDAETKANINARCLADAILVGWEGFTNADGSPLEYSPEAAKALLMDPEMIVLRDAVSFASGIAESKVRKGAAE